MRLTLEEVTLNNLTRKEFSHLNYFLDQEQKELIEYKTIEEDLGIDLGIFAKLLKYGGHIKTVFGIEKFKISNCNIDFKGKLFYVITEHTLRTLLFKDCGKTWALTREELEK